MRPSSTQAAVLTHVLIAASLTACATQRPLPPAEVPTHYQRHAEAGARGTVLLDVVDGPTLVRREQTKSSTLCATPCELALAPGKHELDLFFLDEHGIPAVDKVVLEVNEGANVHRRALTRTRTDSMGLRATGALLFYLSEAIALFGTVAALSADEPSMRRAMGITAGAGVLGMGIAFGFYALGTTRLRGSDVRFARPALPASPP